MKLWLLLVFFSVGLIACKDKEMTLEELKKASWSKLDKGVEYINLKKGKPDVPDSIRISVKGFWGTNITISADMYNAAQPALENVLRPMLNTFLKGSKHGYLKINMLELVKPEYLSGYVSLRDDVDSAEIAAAIKIIKAIQGIQEVSYFSKDLAKKKYLDDGNEDWKNVLDENPLPASLEIKFDRKIITEDDYERIGNQIEGQLLYVSDVYFPKDLYKKFEGNYYILEYRH